MLTAEDPVITEYYVNGKWDGVTWQLSKDWTCVFENERIYLKITIKAGFTTDGGSIPQLFQNVITPLGIYLLAFLVHDALYASEAVSRAEADWILLELLQALGAGWWRRNEIWSAVRIGGGFVWKQHTTESIAAARQLVITEYRKKGATA